MLSIASSRSGIDSKKSPMRFAMSTRLCASIALPHLPDVVAISRLLRCSSCSLLKREYSFCHCDGCSTGITCTAVTLYSRSEEHTSELQSRGHLVCRLLLEKKKKK